MNQQDARLDDIAANLKPTRIHRALDWLWRRNIDPGNLVTWIGVGLVAFAFWAVTGWAIWKALQ